MAGDVQLPMVGSVSKRALLIGGGAAGVVMVLLYLRRRSSSTPATDTTATDTTGTDTSGLDSLGVGGAGAGIIDPNLPQVGTPTSNPQWTALVMQQLSGVVDPSALSSALGKYITGAAVTPDEETIIDQAIAAAGYPPVAGPTGYPPAIRTQPAGGQTPPPPPPPPPTLPPPQPTVPPTPGAPTVLPQNPGTRTYTVVHGDTLIGIASRLGVDWHTLFSENWATIENTAKAHGYPDSGGGHWIFPGEQLHY